ncbi:MAG: 30S ribosomal protein S7 [bacterium]|nr:30S ribosomal protein S7 [bacterium]
MARSGKIKKRTLLNDPIFNSRLVTRMVNRIMQDGKKSVAETLMYNAMQTLSEKGKDPLVVLEAAIRNVGPRMEVRPRRVGGAAYQVPVEVRGDRREALAIRWILIGAKARSSREFHSFSLKLVAELLDAANNVGSAIQKRDNTIKMADANKAFAHFRW